jgi:hypothetical protein
MAAPVAKGTKAPATTVTPPAAPDKAAEKAAKEEKAAKDRFIRVMKDGKGVDSNGKKLPPQAQGICNILEAAGDKGLTREELVAKMKGVIQTRQPEGRILSYYQKAIVARGMVKLVEGA